MPLSSVPSNAGSRTRSRRLALPHWNWVPTSALDRPREAGLQALAVALEGVGDGDEELAVLVLDADGIDGDEVPQPLVQRGLRQVLQGGGELAAVGGEDRLQHAGAEVRPVDPLPRRGEQDLLDEVADVGLLVGERGAPLGVEPVWPAQ